jgi:hypothetical protein
LARAPPRDGDATSRIETGLEVDSNRNGRPWAVAIYRNGAKAVSTTARPSGSFSVRALLADGSGREIVRGLARNGTTGGVSRVTAVF